MKSVTDIIAAISLRSFVEQFRTVRRCFRCHAALDITEENWSSLGQVVTFKKRKPQLVGGVLCEACVDSWVKWRDQYAWTRPADKPGDEL